VDIILLSAKQLDQLNSVSSFQLGININSGKYVILRFYDNVGITTTNNNINNDYDHDDDGDSNTIQR
jgi:hypothetical protein